MSFCGLALVALAGIYLLAGSARAGELGIGEVEPFLELPVGQHPEGITFDRDGNLYFGNRFFGAPGGVLGWDNELRKVSPDGKKDTAIATFAFSPLPGNGILGLAADEDGNVWAAIDGGDDHGVWRISGNGNNAVRIAGSGEIHFPNSLTFDAGGNLYVTDSGPVGCGSELCEVGGAIWRLARGATVIEEWSRDEALSPLVDNPFGEQFNLPGANGIAFYPPDSIYVANTEKSQLFRLPILADGSAGAAEAVTLPGQLPTADGIAVDAHGNVHIVLAAHAVLTALGSPRVPPMVQVDTATGAVIPTTLPGFDGEFDVPLSLTFDTLPGERTIVYSANGDLLVPVPVGQGPRIVRANVGVKGFMIK